MPRKTVYWRLELAVTEIRFNEAAARCRGKLRCWCAGNGRAEPASMRPRPDAAENSIGSGARARSGDCFNEAAARCRGKRLNNETARAIEGTLQ